MSRARRTTVGLVTAAALGAAGVARASAPPVGALPAGPASTIKSVAGERIAVALPQGTAGKAWRIARPFDSGVIQELSEANVGNSVVVVFRAVGKGTTKVSFGLTRGERSKAYAARTYTISVR